MKKIFLSILLSGILFLPLFVLADAKPVASNCDQYCSDPDAFEAPEKIVCICNPLSAPDFETIVGNIINFIFKIAIVLAPLMVIVGGFLLVTAGGDLNKVNQAKNLLLWTAIGFAVVLLSKGILAIINQILGVKGG